MVPRPGSRVAWQHIFLSPPTVISPRSARWCTHDKWKQYYSSSCSCRCLLVIYGYCRERICKHFFTSFLGQNRYSYRLFWHACIINGWSLHFRARDIPPYWRFLKWLLVLEVSIFQPDWDTQGFILRSAKTRCKTVRLNCLKLWLSFLGMHTFSKFCSASLSVPFKRIKANIRISNWKRCQEQRYSSQGFFLMSEPPPYLFALSSSTLTTSSLAFPVCISGCAKEEI